MHTIQIQIKKKTLKPLKPFKHPQTIQKFQTEIPAPARAEDQPKKNLTPTNVKPTFTHLSPSSFRCLG